MIDVGLDGDPNEPVKPFMGETLRWSIGILADG